MTVTVTVGSVGSFFDIVVYGGCVVGVLFLSVSRPILQGTRLPRPYYCLEEFQDSNTYSAERLLSTVTVIVTSQKKLSFFCIFQFEDFH